MEHVRCPSLMRSPLSIWPGRASPPSWTVCPCGDRQRCIGSCVAPTLRAVSRSARMCPFCARLCAVRKTPPRATSSSCSWTVFARSTTSGPAGWSLAHPRSAARRKPSYAKTCYRSFCCTCGINWRATMGRPGRCISCARSALRNATSPHQIWSTTAIGPPKRLRSPRVVRRCCSRASRQPTRQTPTNKNSSSQPTRYAPPTSRTCAHWCGNCPDASA